MATPRLLTFNDFSPDIRAVFLEVIDAELKKSGSLTVDKFLQIISSDEFKKKVAPTKMNTSDKAMATLKHGLINSLFSADHMHGCYKFSKENMVLTRT